MEEGGSPDAGGEEEVGKGEGGGEAGGGGEDGEAGEGSGAGRGEEGGGCGGVVDLDVAGCALFEEELTELEGITAEYRMG